MVEVLEGKFGYLFLTGGDANDIASQHAGRFDITNVIDTIAEAHAGRAEGIARISTGRYVHLIAPNKETVAAGLMPPGSEYEREGMTPVRRYLAAQPSVAPFFQPEALQRCFEDGLYYLTDTHWTFRGAKTYLEAMFEAIGDDARFEALRAMPLKLDDLPFVGDLARHIGGAGEIQEHLLPANPRATLQFENGISNEGRVFHFRNTAAADRLLMLTDSTGSWMFNFLAELYAEILVVHTPDLDLRALELYRPDAMLFVQCERFFPRPPHNAADWRVTIGENEAAKSVPRSAVPYLSKLGYL